MPTYDELLRRSELPRLELRLLLEQATGLSRIQLVSRGDSEIEPAPQAEFERLFAARLAGTPMAYLLGSREFYGRSFAVAPGVLIPRPETEHLVEAALARRERTAALSVVDLGTGSGILAVTLALEAPAWQVAATDVSDEALAIARANASALGAHVDFSQGSWYGALASDASFDLIVSNPPYIAAGDVHLDQGDLRFEPRGALTDEADGLVCLREIAAGAPRRLRQDGWLMVEHGYDQGAAVRALFEEVGLAQVETLPDLAGLDRITIGRRADA
jgi:release factor glutamine methyltransferase